MFLCVFQTRAQRKNGSALEKMLYQGILTLLFCVSKGLWELDSGGFGKEKKGNCQEEVRVTQRSDKPKKPWTVLWARIRPMAYVI